MAKGNWLDFISAVAKTTFEYEWMRPLIVAQSILESGRGTTVLAKDYCNFNGMKFRESVAHLGGTKFKYVTDSEAENGTDHPGWDWFFEFPNYDAAIKTWQAFWFRKDNEWVPYPKVRDRDPSVMKDMRSFLEYVGPIYCPYFLKSHNESYADYIINRCLPEAQKMLKDAAPVPSQTVTWFEFNRTDDGKPAATAYAGDTPKYTRYWKDKKDLIDFLLAFPDANMPLVAETDKKVIPKVPDYGATPNPDPTPGRVLKILLDPGHSLNNPGASSNSGVVKEYVLNRAACETLQAKLKSFGHTVDIFDPATDNLTSIGQKAWNYDICISWHHNSYTGSSNPYHCIMMDPEAPKEWKLIASEMCEAMALALDGTVADTKVFGGTNGIRGVYETQLSVLNASAKDPDGKPPFHCLVEAYFLNPMSNVTACLDASKRAAEAIGVFVNKKFS